MAGIQKEEKSELFQLFQFSSCLEVSPGQKHLCDVCGSFSYFQGVLVLSLSHVTVCLPPQWTLSEEMPCRIIAHPRPWVFLLYAQDSLENGPLFCISAFLLDVIKSGACCEHVSLDMSGSLHGSTAAGLPRWLSIFPVIFGSSRISPTPCADSCIPRTS